MDVAGLILIAALALDLLIGDPVWMPHPVRWVGRLISGLENLLLRDNSGRGARRLKGAVMVLLVVGTVYITALALLYFSYQYSMPLFIGLSVYMIWSSISIKSLGTEARAVVSALETQGLESARARLSKIVGRDTAALSKEEVMRAASETVAENTSDGTIAPLFYLAIGGPALMMAYKAVNTLDSMVGYRDERYADFGLVAARLDDVANYLPARITAIIMVIVSFVLRYDFRSAMATIIRDGRKHPSPNAGIVEAAVAGALNIRFGGPASYKGVIKEKPYIGTGVKGTSRATLISSIRIMEASALLMALGVICTRGLL